MKKDEKLTKFNEWIEEEWIKRTNPKIAQKVKLLRLNENFNKDIWLLRKRWRSLIKRNNILRREQDKIFKKIIKKYQTTDLELKKEDKEIQWRIARKRVKLIQTPAFLNDLLNLAKKYKLYPLDFWVDSLMNVIFYNFFFIDPLRLDIQEYEFPRISCLPSDANFEIRLLKHPSTGEPELLIKLFDDCSWRDIKKYWNYISDRLKKLREIKGIKKRYYPLKNLEIAKKLFELDKEERSDWIKQEKIYGEAGDLDFGKIEWKRKNKIKQIRYRYKKM